jgi:predicted O-methyltransferase YrrM
MDKAKSMAWRIPGISLYRFLKFVYTARRTHADKLLRAYPAGHFHSPLPDLEEVLSRRDRVFDTNTKEIAGIDLRQQEQIELLDRISEYEEELPFRETANQSNRYYYNNDYFSYGDAIVLYGMLRHFKPGRIIEIGSGFSSAVMLDTNDAFLGGAADITFIETRPERLLALAKPGDDLQSRIIQRRVQDVDVSVFDKLEEDDFLFVDSSHVVKFGSDVSHIVFEILPRLARGVILQFHDVFWPFEYPKAWVASGRAWTEAYLLRAFLEHNDVFKILYFNSFMALFHRDVLTQKMPLCLQNPGGSLWLSKVV